MFTKKPEREGSPMDSSRPGTPPPRLPAAPQVLNARPGPAGRASASASANGSASVIGVDLSIRGNAVTFQSSSRVEGDVFHKSLAIEQGAFFEGKSRRSDDPMSVQRTANGVPPPTN